MQDDLDMLLSKRVLPEASSELASRIISAAAQKKVQRSAFGGFSWVQSALAVACMLVFVVAAGLYFDAPVHPAVSLNSEAAIDDIAMYMVYDTLLEIN